MSAPAGHRPRQGCDRAGSARSWSSWFELINLYTFVYFCILLYTFVYFCILFVCICILLYTFCMHLYAFTFSSEQICSDENMLQISSELIWNLYHNPAHDAARCSRYSSLRLVPSAFEPLGGNCSEAVLKDCCPRISRFKKKPRFFLK